MKTGWLSTTTKMEDNAGSDSQTVVVESSGNDHVLSSVTATIIVASLAGPIGDRHRRG
jgi:hypothetical protein